MTNLPSPLFTSPNAEVSEASRKLFDRLFSDGPEPIYVLGRNTYSESVSRVIAIDGFVDDFTSEKEFAGKPLFRADALPRDCIFISCVVEARPLTALARLRKAGFSNVIDYFTLVRLAPNRFYPIVHSAFNCSDIAANQEKYQWIHRRLSDDESRRTLEKVTRFRLTWDLDLMRGFSLDYQRQYFEEFVRFGGDEIFVDGGGYDGQTTRTFVERCPSYKRVYYFEPSSDMMELSRIKLGDLRDISFVTKGLFSRNDRLRFDSSAGSASHISDQGSTEIQVVRLDDEVHEPVTFMKMDLEGAECDAIEGAREHIKASHPKLAVSVYHDQRDFWRVPETVLKIDDSYAIYLRHYTEGPLETVMYFV